MEPELLFRVQCGDGKICPAAYRLDNRTALVQGYIVEDPHGVELGPNETLVKVPIEVLLEAARALK
jgi:hypothetical protein